MENSSFEIRGSFLKPNVSLAQFGQTCRCSCSARREPEEQELLTPPVEERIDTIDTRPSLWFRILAKGFTDSVGARGGRSSVLRRYKDVGLYFLPL
jgi:hypothetical protein